jgi:hypothetical protein
MCNTWRWPKGRSICNKYLTYSTSNTATCADWNSYNGIYNTIWRYDARDCIAWMTGRLMNMGQLMEWELAREKQLLGESVPQCRFVHLTYNQSLVAALWRRRISAFIMVRPLCYCNLIIYLPWIRFPSVLYSSLPHVIQTDSGAHPAWVLWALSRW